jgi:hypothetical protein
MAHVYDYYFQDLMQSIRPYNANMTFEDANHEEVVTIKPRVTEKVNLCYSLASSLGHKLIAM